MKQVILKRKRFSSTVSCSGKIILDIAISLLMDYDICRRTVTGVAMSNGRAVSSEDIANSCPSGSNNHGYGLGLSEQLSLRKQGGFQFI
jgi:hypothetical protein